MKILSFSRCVVPTHQKPQYWALTTLITASLETLNAHVVFCPSFAQPLLFFAVSQSVRHGTEIRNRVCLASKKGLVESWGGILFRNHRSNLEEVFVEMSVNVIPRRNWHEDLWSVAHGRKTLEASSTSGGEGYGHMHVWRNHENPRILIYLWYSPVSIVTEYRVSFANFCK